LRYALRVDRFARPHALTGMIQVTLGQTPDSPWVRRHPHVEVDVRVSGQRLDLVSAGIDAAIRIAKGRLDDSTLTARKIGELHVGIFAAPSYLETHGVPRSPEEATSHQWVVFPGFRELQFRGAGGRARVRPAGRVTSDDMTFVQSAIVHGIGLGVLPMFLADADVRQGRLLQVLPGLALFSGTIWFLTPPAHRKTARALDTLRGLHHRSAHGQRARLAGQLAPMSSIASPRKCC
jgi:DNA-binding transcriptional LysR family regulator